MKINKDEPKGIREDASETMKLVSQLKTPDFGRAAEYVAMRGEMDQVPA